ncbi:MAG: hypothetical protein O3C63_06410 [Cyanobacteria bacterium]|nr:hypothetical protein [Cyanobacteriota bacterium]
MSVTSSSSLVSDFVKNLKTSDLVRTGQSFSKAPGSNRSRSILKELSAALLRNNLLIPFLNTMFALLSDDYRADLDAITQFHELSARHDELADILNSNDTSVSDFKSSETLVDEQRASSSFTYNDNRKIRSVTMSYVPDLKSQSISLIRIDSVMPIGLYSGDVAAESKLEEVLKDIWLRNYESIN